MTFRAWIDRTFPGSPRAVLWVAIHDSLLPTLVSARLIRDVYHGKRMQIFEQAKALSDLTCGAVSVEELCK